MTKGDAHALIDRLIAESKIKSPPQPVTANQLNMLKQILKRTPEEELKKLTKERASKIIYAYTLLLSRMARTKASGGKDPQSLIVMTVSIAIQCSTKMAGVMVATTMTVWVVPRASWHRRLLLLLHVFCII